MGKEKLMKKKVGNQSDQIRTKTDRLIDMDKGVKGIDRENKGSVDNLKEQEKRCGKRDEMENKCNVERGRIKGQREISQGVRERY